MLTALGNEWRIVAFAPICRAAVWLAVGVGVLVACGPVVFLGNPQSLGLSAFPVGVLAGSATAALVGPAAAVVILGADYDTGTRQARFLAGERPRATTWRQTVAILAFVTAYLLGCGVLGLLASVADVTARLVMGQSVHQLQITSATIVRSLGSWALVLAVTLSACWLVASVRSGIRAAWGLSVLSMLWPLLLLGRASPVPAFLLDIHPFTLAGLAVYEDLPVAGHGALRAAALVVWVVALTVFGVRGAAVPGGGRES